VKKLHAHRTCTTARTRDPLALAVRPADVHRRGIDADHDMAGERGDAEVVERAPGTL
jgi:hypothetical protein